MSHSLEHAYDVRVFLSKAKDLLKENGLLFLEVPNCDNPETLNKSIMKEPHLSHFTRTSLKCLFDSFEFKIIKFDSMRYGYLKNKLSFQLGLLKFLLLKFLLLKKDIYKKVPDEQGDAYRILLRRKDNI